MHYVAAIASYCVEVKIREGSISGTENEQRRALLSLFSIPSVNNDCQDNTVTMRNETSKFSAEASRFLELTSTNRLFVSSETTQTLIYELHVLRRATRGFQQPRRCTMWVFAQRSTARILLQ